MNNQSSNQQRKSLIQILKSNRYSLAKSSNHSINRIIDHTSTKWILEQTVTEKGMKEKFDKINNHGHIYQSGKEISLHKKWQII